jgi:SAM-dependent methyltransferase
MERDITSLPRIVPAPEGKPVRPEALDNQRLMASIVDDPSSWSPELAHFTGQVFDSLAASWVDDRGAYRPAPLIDALERGSVPAVGRCLEIGSGTGILTSHLQEVWSEIISVDISMGMMRRSPHSCQVQADASKLPFPDSAFEIVAIGDAPLFAGEAARVLGQPGTLIWSNALGTGAPYYVPTPDLFDALANATSAARWSAIESDALWGSWVVFHQT